AAEAAAYRILPGPKALGQRGGDDGRCRPRGIALVLGEWAATQKRDVERLEESWSDQPEVRGGLLGSRNTYSVGDDEVHLPLAPERQQGGEARVAQSRDSRNARQNAVERRAAARFVRVARGRERQRHGEDPLGPE